MSKPQDTKNEQQKDLCITSEQLTEQWRKGELESGWYWCKCYDEETKLLYYDGESFELDDPETKNYYFFLKKDCAEITILEKVPSYEEWQDLKSKLQLKETSYDFDTARLEEENTKLKELLHKNRQKMFEAEKNYGFDDSIIDILTPQMEKIDKLLGDKIDEPQS